MKPLPRFRVQNQTEPPARPPIFRTGEGDKRFRKRVTIRVEVWQVGTNVSLKHNAYIYMTNQKYYLNHNMSMVWKRITEFSRPDRRSYLIAMAFWMFFTWLNRTKYSIRDMASSGGEDVLLECDAVWNGEKLPTLWKSKVTASSG